MQRLVSKNYSRETPKYLVEWDNTGTKIVFFVHGYDKSGYLKDWSSGELTKATEPSVGTRYLEGDVNADGCINIKPSGKHTKIHLCNLNSMDGFYYLLEDIRGLPRPPMSEPSFSVEAVESENPGITVVEATPEPTQTRSNGAGATFTLPADLEEESGTTES